MSTAHATRLLLVRHAQASYGTHDYDRLSERGHQQAALLAQWWAHDSGLQIDHVFVGAQRRHTETLNALQTAAHAARRPLPQATVDADWNEFDHESLLRAYVQWAPDDTDLPHLRDGRDPTRVQAILARAFHAWNSGVFDQAMPESLPSFRQRVNRARARVESAVGRGTALVVSSGGVIARCTQALLNLDEATTIQHNLSLANSGIVELVGQGGTWRIARWSDLPHLQTEPHRALRSWF